MLLPLLIVLPALSAALSVAGWRVAVRRRRVGRGAGPQLWQRRLRRRAAVVEPLHPDDAAPVGLAPLVPSPRVLQVEAARGIRELESWLAGRASA